jgi:hypothetical protein
MSNLSQIANRHVRDHWRDALFIAAALLLMAISIGSVTSKAAKADDRSDNGWSVSVVESNLEIGR